MARYLPHDNLSYPVLIELEDGSTGSGFFLMYSKSKMFLVTALHVLYEKREGNNIMRSQKVKLTSYDKDLQILTPVITELNLTLLPIKKNDSKDIVLVQMANLIPVSSSDQYTVSPLEGVIRASVGNQSNVMVEDTNLKKFNDVLISNEVFILGYPSSLSFNNDPQIEYKRPLLRKGIVAGKNLIKETIILDCPVYFGNSGGIVIQVDEIGNGVRKFNIIGVVSQYIPFVERLKSLQLGYENVSFENSGYSVAVPTDTILELAGS